MLNMTPGPTSIHENVRLSLSKDYNNSDLERTFVDFYAGLAKKIGKLMNTANNVLILCGEGMLALEAACISLIEKGDRVLCIDNGIFGNGFKELIEMAGGTAVMYTRDYESPINIEELENFLKKDSNFKIATLVHCETPTAITNPVDKICPLLNRYGIISVVDSVSAIGGENIEIDNWNMDVVLGASQKCISAPTGLCFLSISQTAWDKILNRRNPITSYYLNLSNYKDYEKNRWFPHTMPSHLIYALDTAINRMIAEEQFVSRHERMAKAVRAAIIKSGLKLFGKSGYSNTVTAVHVPEGITFQQIFRDMLNLDVMIGGSIGEFENKLIRIGHMGENCNEESISLALAALDRVLRTNGLLTGELLNHLFAKELV